MAPIIMVIKACQIGNCLLALLRVERALKLDLHFLKFSDFKRFRASKRTLIFIFLYAVHALETKGLLAWSVAFVRF